MKRVFKIAILAVLAFASLESASADNKLESKDGNAQAKTVTQDEQDDPLKPSAEDRALYDKLFRTTCYGKAEKKTDLKKTDKVHICYCAGIVDLETKKQYGDAIFIEYKQPEIEEEYLKRKKEGKNPNPEAFPTQKTYLIPIPKEGTYVSYYKDSDLEFITEKCAKIETSRYCFKWEVYPDMFCKMNSMGYISRNDAREYFNFPRDGWCDFDLWEDKPNRYGLTKKIWVSEEDAKLIVNCIKQIKK